MNRTGQGTSFAVAITAGVAALWLEKFGWNTLRNEAHGRGLPLQDLFRAALRQTAQVPPGWDGSRMGAGIVDAQELLALAPKDIVTGAELENTSPALELFGQTFEDEGLEAEADNLAFDWRLRARSEASITVESALREHPSEELAAKLKDVEPIGAPGLVLAPAAPPAPLDHALRRVAAGQVDPVEGGEGLSYEASVDQLRGVGVDDLIQTAKDAFDTRAASAVDLVDTSLQSEALDRIRQAVESHLDPDGPHEITADEAGFALEALVMLSGRPAIRVRSDGSELFDPLLGSWAGDLVPDPSRWQPLTQAVGRIDARNAKGDWIHVGTGFLLEGGHVMTNRHVIDAFAEPIPSQDGSQRFHLRFPVSIIFDPEARDSKTRYTLTEVITAGGKRIGRSANMAKLDMAVLRIDPNNGHAAPPAPIDRGLISASDPDLSKILVTGYPAEPRNVRGPDPDQDREEYIQFWSRLRELYGEEYGVKYISPGRIEARPGSVAGDPLGWVFSHDATTLQGNSGSGIFTLQGLGKLCGLHFGGRTLEMNLAHDIQTVFNGGDGVFSSAFLHHGVG